MNTKTYEKVTIDNFNVKAQHYELIDDEYKEASLYVEGRPYYIKVYYPMEEIAECWEIKNNQGQRTSFVKVDFEETTDTYSEVKDMTSEKFASGTYYIVSHINTSSGEKTYELAEEYNANKVYYTKQSGVLSVLGDFEYRYSAFEDEIDHAIEGTDEFASATQADRNAVILHRMRNFKAMADGSERLGNLESVS